MNEPGKARVLVLGAEADALSARFREEGYEVRAGGEPAALEGAILAAAPDAVIIAVGPADGDVVAALARLRAREVHRNLPILLIASRELLDGALAPAFAAMTEGLLSPVSVERLLNRLAATLEIRRRLELGERRSERLIALNEISLAVNSTLDSGAILYIIARKIAESMELVRCSFIVPDLQNGVGRVIACKDDPNISSLEINLANYPEIMQVLRSGRRVLIDDAETDPIMAGIRKFADVFRDQSIMTLPLEFDGQIIGVLQIRKKSQRQGFSEREIEYCELLSAAAASALKNAQLYEDIERHNEVLRRSKRELEQLSTELLRKNQELIELQRMKEEFTMMLVHDLRNPLMIVQGVLDLLRHQSKGNVDENALVADGISVTRRILDLINHLLEISRLESSEFRLAIESLDFAALVRETLAPFRSAARGRDIALDVQIGNELPPVAGDRRGLGQVLDNLVGNALKFTPDGGRIRVTVEATGEAASAGAGVRLVVEDSGTGIAPEDLPNVFNKFHQGRERARKGSGLGLAIVKLMVLAHGGTVNVESKPGSGSRFVVTLPGGTSVVGGPELLGRAVHGA